MASGRMLQRKISKSHDVARLIEAVEAEMGRDHGAYAALLFTWCIAHQDVAGRMHGDPRLVRADVFPLLETVTTAHVERYLHHMDAVGLAQWYEAEGRKWLAFPGFDGSQPGLRKDREPKSTVPPPPARCRSNAGNPPAEIRQSAGNPPAEVKEKVREENTNSRAHAWTKTAFDALWREVVRKSVTGDHAVLARVTDRIADAARDRGVADVPGFARKLLTAFVDQVAEWKAAGKPHPQLSVEAFERNFVRCEEIADGERDPKAIPSDKPQPSPPKLRDARDVIREQRAEKPVTPEEAEAAREAMRAFGVKVTP